MWMKTIYVWACCFFTNDGKPSYIFFRITFDLGFQFISFKTLLKAIVMSDHCLYIWSENEIFTTLGQFCRLWCFSTFIFGLKTFLEPFKMSTKSWRPSIWILIISIIEFIVLKHFNCIFAKCKYSCSLLRRFQNRSK